MNLIGQEMSMRLNFRTRNKTIFWSTWVTPKSINNEFNQPDSFNSFLPQPKVHSVIHSFYYERSWTDNREPRHKTQREKACNLLLSMWHVVAKIIRNHTCGPQRSSNCIQLDRPPLPAMIVQLYSTTRPTPATRNDRTSSHFSLTRPYQLPTSPI